MHKKYKLGLDVRTMSPKGTGIGRVEIELVKQFIRLLPESEWKIYLFTGPETDYDIINLSSNVMVVDNIKNQKSIIKRAIWYSPFYAYKNKLDIFHSLDFIGPVWKLNFKLIHTIHDIIPILFKENASKKSIFMCKYIMPVMFSIDDLIITSSENTKKDILNNYRVNEEKIKVIPLAGRDEFKEKISDKEILKIKNRYGIKKKYFLFIGTLEPKKNVIRILKAFLKIKKDNSSFSLVFAGAKGWGVDEIYDLARSNRDVIFTGFVPDYDLKVLLRGAFAFVFPSIYEGFGLPVLDAFNAEIPVITSNTSSLPEIAKGAALLVNPYSVQSISKAMIKLIKDSQLRQKLVKAGKIKSNKFKWEKTAKKIIKLYYDLIK